MFEGLRLPASADFHVHLRDGPMCEAVTPKIRDGGVDMVYVMPNLVPPITTVEMALEYQKKLEALEPRVTFLLSLYLHSSLTPNDVIDAKKAGIRGIKAYPAGVTTHSTSGVVDWSTFYPVFGEMENSDLILNLHGECPSCEDENITVMNAEERFVPVLLKLHKDFPRLRICLEHCTTAVAVEAVRSCGPNVVGTITAHHLFLVTDDWAGNSFNFCKPVAKTPQDRDTLLVAAASGNPKFFFGSDSAPHTTSAKLGRADGEGKQAAGVYTAPYATALVLDAFEQGCRRGLLQSNQLTSEVVAGFLGRYGRAFYQEPQSSREILIGASQSVRITDTTLATESDQYVVPFRKGQLTRALQWA